MKNSTIHTLPLQTGDYVQWNAGEGQVLEDMGDMVAVYIEAELGYTIVEVEKTELHIPNA